MKKDIVITIVILICGVGGVLFFNFGQSKMKDKDTPNTSTTEVTETVEITEPTTEKTTEVTTKKTEGVTTGSKTTTKKVTTTKKTTTKKSTSGTTKGTTKSTTKKSTTTKKVTTKVTTTVEEKCTPLEGVLPEGAVWYKVWGPDEPLDFGDWDDYYAEVDPMGKLMDIAWDIQNSVGGARTGGGLMHVSCTSDTFSFYGAYFLVEGWSASYDENGNFIKETKVAKGYMRPDGSVKWLYKNF